MKSKYIVNGDGEKLATNEKKISRFYSTGSKTSIKEKSTKFYHKGNIM